MCMCTRMCMVTKTITIMEDAYKLLLRNKNGEESFSDVIRKLTGDKKDIMSLAGAWKHLTNKEVEDRKKDVLKLRKKSTEELLKQMHRMKNNDLH